MINVDLSTQNIFDSLKSDYTASSSNYYNKYAIAAEGLVLQLTASYSFNNFRNKQRGRADDASFKGGDAFKLIQQALNAQNLDIIMPY